MSDTPLVSIIVPAFNAKKYIKETIESVLNQTYKNWELIVVDDGSTDETAEIVQSFSDDKIILIKQDNRGVSSARNRGIDKAGGKYITFLDADDVLPPHSLEVRVKYLEDNKNIDLLDGKIFLKDSELKDNVKIYTPYYKGKLLPRIIDLDSRVFCHVCYMIRSKALNKVRFKEGMTHAEDLLFCIELASKENINYGHVNEDIYWNRVGHISAMSNLDGLDNGYFKLIKEVKKLENVSKISYLKFKIRIAKTMTLIWLNQKKITKALRSAYRLLLEA